MRRSITITEAIARRADEYRRQSLADQYHDLAGEVRELLPLADHPNALAPRLTRRLGELETRSGRTPPVGTLTAGEVLRIARDRSQLP